jgi:hypothetical protein
MNAMRIKMVHRRELIWILTITLPGRARRRCRGGARGGVFSPWPAAPQEQTLLAPELSPHGGKGVGEGRPQLAIPSIGADGGAGAVVEACREQGHDREQREQAGRGAGDCPIAA